MSAFPFDEATAAVRLGVSKATLARDRRCPYCAGVIYTDAGCQNCKLGSAHNPSSGEMT